MKRKGILTALLILLLLTDRQPHPGTDVAELLPIEIVRLEKRENQYVLTTDTEASGSGSTIAAAVQNMKDTSSGTVFLETADFLVTERECLQDLDRMARYIRPGSRILKADTVPALPDLAGFLRQHEPETTLADWRGGICRISVLVQEGENWKIVP